MNEADVIVVGAGFSGLAAARFLAESGVSVIVLEARDRVGGRSFHYSDDKYHCDRGAAYWGSGQTELLDLAKEFGIQTYKVFEEGKNVQFFNNVRAEYSGTIPPLGVAALLDTHFATKKVDALSEKINLEKPWLSPNAKELDYQTIESFAKEKIFWTNSARGLIEVALRTVLCAELGSVSALSFLQSCKSVGSLMYSFSTEDGGQQGQFVGGTQQIAEGLSSKIKKINHCSVELSTVISEIQQASGKTTILTTDNRKFISKRVIVTLPIPLCGRIKYTPSLPAMRDQVHQRTFMGTVMKIHLYYETPFWRKAGFSGQILSDQGPISATFDDCEPNGKCFSIMGFIVGKHYFEVCEKTQDERKKLITEQYAKLFGLNEFRNPIYYDEMNWNTEEFSRGGYSALFPTGLLVECGKAITEPCGLIHWAGSDLSEKFSGYLEGALRSGKQVASEVKKLLNH